MPERASPRAISGALSDEERTLALLRGAARRDGLNPRAFLSALSRAIETRMWEHLPDGPVSFHEFVARAGLTADALEAVLQIPAEHEDELPEEHERFEATRRHARELLTQPGPRSGEVGRGRNRSDIIRPKQGGTARNETLSRLRRDRPDLAVRVDVGELSANAAAIEAGWRKPMRSIPIDSPDAAIEALLRVFSREQLQRALRLT